MRLPVTGLLLTALAVGALPACSGAPPQVSPTPAVTPAVGTLQVASSDGKVTLTIPAGGLPPGVSASDITISPISNGDVLAAFELSPSGTQFGTPIEVTVALDGPATAADIALPMLALFAETGYELLSDQTVEIDLDAGTQSITGSLPHFSVLNVAGTPFRISVEGPVETVVGFPFDVFATTHGWRWSSWTWQDQKIVALPTQLEYLNLELRAGPNLTPQRKPLNAIDPTRDRTFKETFTCEEATDRTYVVFAGGAKWSGTLLVFEAGNPDRDLDPTTLGIRPDQRKVVDTTTVFFELQTHGFPCESNEPPTLSPAPPVDFGAVLDNLTGTYDVERVFAANSCGYGTHHGTGDLLAEQDGEFAFNIVNDAPLLSHMEYTGVVNSDLTFTMQENAAPDFYNAQVTNGTIAGNTLTFDETIEMFRDDSPCKGQTFQAHTTATKTAGP